MIRQEQRDGIAWCEAGEGPAVVFLHGLGGSRTAWNPQLRHLARSHRAAAWDLPGYGQSEPLPRMTFVDLVDSWERWIDTMGLDRVALVGLSFGGMIAQHVALALPDRVRALVLADTSPAFGLDGTTADDWLATRLDALRDGRRPADIASEVIASIAGPALSAPMRDELVGAFARIEPGPFAAACRCLVTHDLRDRLHEITTPCLVVVGENDHETPLAYAEALASGLADAQLRVVSGAGHLTPSEKPDEFNQLVAAFLSRPSNREDLS